MSDELLSPIQLEARPELADELEVLQRDGAAASLRTVGSVPPVDDLDIGPFTLEERLERW
jgi:hypothetical protein